MKKSSDNTNRPRKLEEVFRDGFEPAEVSPRASIWHHIEQELEVKQAGYYKKRLVWYRSIAAASITLLVLAVSYFWYDALTGHGFKLPTTNGTIVQDNTTRKSGILANSNNTNSSDQAKNLKKEQASEITVTQTRQAEQLARTTYRESKKNKLREAKTRPTQLAKAQQQSPDRFFGFAKKELEASKTASDKINSGGNKNFNPENELARVPEQMATAPKLPMDSSKVMIAGNNAEFKKDSAVVITAALLPEKTEKKTAAPRWAIGGGTGSQYFEQNIKFANAATNSFATTPQAYAFSNVSKSVGNNTIEAASKEFNENTRSAFSYRAAVATNYRINDKWSIEVGLNFAENKAQTTTSYIIYKRPAALNAIANIKPENAFLNNKSDGITSNVTIPVTIFLARLTDTDLTNAQTTVEQVTPFNMYYRYRQLGMPVRLRYQHGRGKWFNFVQAGGAINVLLQTSILSDSPKVPAVEYPLGHSSPFRKWYLTALGSVGRGLKISEVWQVQGSLDVARSFSTLTLSPDQIPNLSQQKPYYVGFGISSSYVIGKR